MKKKIDWKLIGMVSILILSVFGIAAAVLSALKDFISENTELVLSFLMLAGSIIIIYRVFVGGTLLFCLKKKSERVEECIEQAQSKAWIAVLVAILIAMPYSIEKRISSISPIDKIVAIVFFLLDVAAVLIGLYAGRIYPKYNVKECVFCGTKNEKGNKCCKNCGNDLFEIKTGNILPTELTSIYPDPDGSIPWERFKAICPNKFKQMIKYYLEALKGEGSIDQSNISAQRYGFTVNEKGVHLIEADDRSVEESRSISRGRKLTVMYNPYYPDEAGDMSQKKLLVIDEESEKLYRFMRDEWPDWGTTRKDVAVCNQLVRRESARIKDKEGYTKQTSSKHSYSQTNNSKQRQKRTKQDGKKKLKQWIMYSIILILVLLVAFIGINNTIKDKNDQKMYAAYNNAYELFTKGNYTKAIDAFKALGEYNDSAEFAQYCAALYNMQLGKYHEARRILRELGDFRNSVILLETIENNS